MPVNRKRLRDLGLEVLIAVALVGGILVWAEFGPRHTPLPTRLITLVGMWITFIVFTDLVFWYPLWRYRCYWSRISFRWAFAGLLCAHLAVYVPLVLRVRDLGELWFMIARPLARIPAFPFERTVLFWLWILIFVPVEWAVICPLLERAAKPPTK